MQNAPWVICRWHITEEEIKAAFVTAFNKLVTEREEIAANARLVRQTLCDTTDLEQEKASLQQELAVLVEIDPELHRREREDYPRPGGVPETLQRLGREVRESQGTGLTR